MLRLVLLMALLWPGTAMAVVMSAKEITPNTDEIYNSAFWFRIDLEDDRPRGPYSESVFFSMGGAHWKVAGTVTFSGDASAAGSETMSFSSIGYTHLTHPHPSEAISGYASLPRTFTASDYLNYRLDMNGNRVPKLDGKRIRVWLFNVEEPHIAAPGEGMGQGHDDTFKGKFGTTVGTHFIRPDNDVFTIFKRVDIRFESVHPAPVPPAALALGSALAGLVGLGWMRRRQKPDARRGGAKNKRQAIWPA
ncbi:hypothetical protein AB0T83_13730 [Fluviibacterium sp. DFM31]|uniref:PEP-CTERM sorting domain-containing protein n=1 Tax=Meridianimarinicoccus marinus TaxID=3231483 RepID=A0ABV3L8D4_9RHOB